MITKQGRTSDQDYCRKLLRTVVARLLGPKP
jgi:hypothetical protein